MRKSILKFELVFLFITTLFSFASFYYGDALPDNAFSITSDNSGNFLGYYFFSLVNYFSYFTGPWAMVPFFIFALMTSFVYDKRDYGVDTLNFFPLFFFFAGLSYFAYPDVLGRGLFFVFKEYFDPMWLGLYTATALIAFLIGTFRSSFKETVVQIAQGLIALPGKISAAYRKVAGLFKKEPKEPVVGADVRSRVANMLKAETKRKEDMKPSTSLKEALKQKMSKVSLSTARDDASEDDHNEQINESRNSENQLRAQPLHSGEDRQVDRDNFINTPEFSIADQVKAKADDINDKVEKIKEKEPIKPLNRVADVSRDKNYFNIVTTISESVQEKISKEPDAKYFEGIIEALESKLAEFNIEGQIVNVLKGPVVDTFEFRPGSGVKVSKIQNLADDLSLALFGVSIRIVTSMAGRDTVGIEVPRNPREIIYLDEVLKSKDFEGSQHALPIAMGRDAYGETFVIDLASCPHMLVAGATGAGKSVFINSLLVSLLVKKSPKKMKLILIDPKQLELALYTKLPHLVMPVITDAKRASIALLWAVQEMERRYAILKEFGVRGISGFNEKLKRATPEMLANIHQLYENQGCEDYELPHLVVVVDEFADLILTKAGKEIENNIARLAAKARAAGIHLVLATQRPSVDVITGVIKANFPTRVSFRVTSPTDSRTILDKVGAEKLLGKGDMLYKHGINMQRVHSSFVQEDEIESLTKKLEEIPQDFNDHAIDFLDNGGEEVEMDDYTFGSHISTSTNSSDDDIYNQALKIVMETRSASASFLQRRLRIGYNRAANLIEEMEQRGVVGPAQGSKPRKVLISGDESTL